MDKFNNLNLISASAGSGKTYRLSRELGNLIISGKLQPEKMLVTTFTRKAAAELQQRIRQTILASKTDDSKEAVSRRIALAQRVFNGLVGTVNSVCGEVVTSQAIEAGLAPSLDIVSEDNMDRVFAVAAQNVLLEASEEIDGFGRLAWRLGLSPEETNRKHDESNQNWQKSIQYIVYCARANAMTKPQLQESERLSCLEIDEVFPGNEDFSLENMKECVRSVLEANADAVKGLTGANSKKALIKLNKFLRESTWPNAFALVNVGAGKRDGSFLEEPGRKNVLKLMNSSALNKDLKDMISRIFTCASLCIENYADYKREQGLIDFTDQESLMYEFFSDKAKKEFRDAFGERVDKIMVDEFQDTSPIELALFLKANELAKDGSLWVGDPKQAIYGFRGTDPGLMLAAGNALPKEAKESLKESWRSRSTLIDFTNAVFKAAFKNELTDENTITLDVAQKRLAESPEKCTGGIIEAWCLEGKGEYKSIANGIKDLLDRKIPLCNSKMETQCFKAGEIAVLLRTNEHCKVLAKALFDNGIEASASQGNLFDTYEGTLAMAAYRYSVDWKDTIALSLVVTTLDLDPEWLGNLGENPHEAIKKWREIPQIKKLRKFESETPLEIMDRVIIELKIDLLVRRMSNPSRHLKNLDELRKTCVKYMDECHAARTTPSVTGFVLWCEQNEIQEAASDGENTVKVLTYHNAKGLEWPVVILGDIETEEKNPLFDVSVRECSKTDFDLSESLKGRTIRYWPYPLGSKKKLDYEDVGVTRDLWSETMNKSSVRNAANERIALEERCLMYVGMTRAKSMLVFAMSEFSDKDRKDLGTPGVYCSWLDNLTQTKSLFRWNIKDSLFTWAEKMQIGAKEFNIIYRRYSDTAPSKPQSINTCLLLKEPTIENMNFTDYKLSPSKLDKCTGTASLIKDLGVRIQTFKCSDKDFENLGNAFHNFIAFAPKNEDLVFAERVLKNWKADKIISAKDMTLASSRLMEWLKITYPASKIQSEVPVVYRNSSHQLMQGFIDMLLESDDDCIVIDHKAYHSENPNAMSPESYAAGCASQLNAYKTVVEKATGKKVKALLIHFPLLGLIYSVDV